MRIVGVKRSNEFSPNHVGNDTAIFNLTVRALSQLGHRVEVCDEAKFVHTHLSGDAIFSMARHADTIDKLIDLSRQGVVVVNSGWSVNNCAREPMTALLLANHIPYPDSITLNTSDMVAGLLENYDFTTCWVKRGDHHAIHREDVSFARNRAEAEGVLREYALRGIERAVINRHLEGDLIKFYGVAHTNFFYWFYPCEVGHSKFGHEQINGRQSGIPFSLEQLRYICLQAAHLLQVRVYGGDCIVSPTGEIRIIDFNDWPSFAPCRELAAPYIAEAIVKEVASHHSIHQLYTF